MSTIDAIALDATTIVETLSRFITTEYASLTASGAPVTWPVTPYLGAGSRTVDVSTGLTYPLKAERARRRPDVALSFSYPAGSGIDDAPTVVVQGLATVRDADLVATSARYLQASSDRFPDMFAKVPDAVLKRAAYYWTRLWVEVTPTRVLWWPGGDLDRAPIEWQAPEGTTAPPSDPAAPGRVPGSWRGTAPDWRDRAKGALDRLGLPVLTTVDAHGRPLPLRTRAAVATADGFVVEPPAGVEVASGPAFLTFHTHAEQFDSQENIGLAGRAEVHGGEVRFVVERALADWGVPRNPLRSVVSMVRAGRRLRPRLDAEAARRGQPLPTFEQLGVATSRSAT